MQNIDLMRSSLRRVSFALGTATLSLVTLSRDAEASGYLTARFGSDHGTPAALTLTRCISTPPPWVA